MTVTEPTHDAPPVDMVNLTIDDVPISVPKGTLVIRAAELMGVQIPRFCDHPLLDAGGRVQAVPRGGRGSAQADGILHGGRSRRHGGPDPAHLVARTDRPSRA